MFTGIVQHIGTVRKIEAMGGSKRLTVDLGPLMAGLAHGQSVCVSGGCLTVCAMEGQTASFDVVAETLTRTTLGRLASGARVNLERSLRLGDGLDGHIVQGHIDGLARLRSIRQGPEYVLEYEGPQELTELMVPKGSVAIEGVSLTLVDATARGFSVAIIPTTLAATTLGMLRPGDEVNIETDIIGRYIRKYVRQDGGHSKGITMERLQQEGFM